MLMVEFKLDWQIEALFQRPIEEHFEGSKQDCVLRTNNSVQLNPEILGEHDVTWFRRPWRRGRAVTLGGSRLAIPGRGP